MRISYTKFYLFTADFDSDNLISDPDFAVPNSSDDLSKQNDAMQITSSSCRCSADESKVESLPIKENIWLTTEEVCA